MKISRDRFSATVLLLVAALFMGNWAWSAADYGNTSVISSTDASNASGTMPSWSGSAAPSTIDDAGRALQGATARWWEATNFSITSSGTAPAFVVAYAVAPAALRSGQAYCFTTHAAAVGTDTLNVNALGAKNFKKVVSGSKTNLAANDFYTGEKICAAYDGTDMVLIQKTTTDLSAYAALASANTFTATQTIQSTDAGAGSGPFLQIDRFSASPAANDAAGQITFQGRDSGGNTTTYAALLTTILDPTDTSEDGRVQVRTNVAGAVTAQMSFDNGAYMEGATGNSQGAGTLNATEYYKNGVRATRHLIATLTTTSGTTHSVTDIPAYRELYIEVAGVSFSVSNTLTLAVSDDNGANYGTARNIAVVTGSAGGTVYGTIAVGNIQASDTFVSAHSVTALATGAGTVTAAILAEAGGGGAVINAIQFAGGTFDAGTIRVYGLL